MGDIISKVRVHGKAQNRTVLGIVNAYLVMYPQTTAEELRKAFPGKLTECYAKFDNVEDVKNPRKDGSGLFHEVITRKGKRVWAVSNEKVDGDRFLFVNKEDTIHTADGKELAMELLWDKAAFMDMIKWAKQYGIEVASFEEHKGGPIKGSYRLEYLNGYVPPYMETSEKKNIPWWIFAIIGFILLMLFILLFRTCDNKPAPVEKVIVMEKVVTKVDTITIVKVEKEIETIEKNFNAAKFEKGKVELTDEAKFVLYDLQKLMNKDENKNVKLKIVGHTSIEGDVNYNQKLSENRAKAVVDFLLSQGISADRLSYEGKGSSEPLDENNIEVNRRTQILVVAE